MKTDEIFRKMYGDELANQVEQLKNKPVRIVRKPEPLQIPPPPSELVQTGPNWWDR